MPQLRLINCKRENEREAVSAEIAAKIAEREAIPWDWADYAALGAMAKHAAIYERTDTPVADVLRELEFPLEDEQFRTGLADTIRRISGA